MGRKSFFWFLCILFVIFISVFVNAQVCKDKERRGCPGFTDVGECSKGYQICIGSEWSICFDAKGPVEEICDNGKDDDCDGLVDEGCECKLGEKRSCKTKDYKVTGICKLGVEFCTDSGEWSRQCINEILPEVTEKCGAGFGNNLDDDCDGLVDEGCKTVPQDPPFTCKNKIKDGNETGVDCGGVCGPCNDCSNGIRERDEVRVRVDFGNETISDCGGLNCPRCPTCNDGIKNQGEDGMDCGGPCSNSCVKPGEEDEDSDFATKNEELLRGTDPRNSDTDNDGILDGKDTMPLCPNLVCDEIYGENDDTCPEDCGKGIGGFLIVLFVLFVLVIAIVIFFYFQFKSTSKTLESKSTKVGFGDLPSSGGDFGKGGGGKRDFRRISSVKLRRGKERESEAEKRLRKSLERAEKLKRKKK